MNTNAKQTPDAAKVRSSCEEGPGQSALQSAYHNPQLDENELFFLLAAAWVDPGRNALQSAEQRC